MTVQATGHTWDVCVAPAEPTVTGDLSPGETQRLWSPASATLISGKRDARGLPQPAHLVIETVRDQVPSV